MFLVVILTASRSCFYTALTLKKIYDVSALLFTAIGWAYRFSACFCSVSVALAEPEGIESLTS